MNYSAMIQARRSTRAFEDRKVPASAVEEIRNYYETSVKQLIPGRKTELHIFCEDVKAALEGAAGYNEFLVGAPHYMVLLTRQDEEGLLNAGFIMEDLVLNLTDMGLASCWVTFTNSELVKSALGIESDLDVAAIVAFGYGQKVPKRIRLNIRSMSNIDIQAKRHFFEPKKSISDLVFLDTWGNTHKVNDTIGFFDDILWESFYAVSLSPSYLNRQAYGFLIHNGAVTLVSRPDEYTTDLDGLLSLGIALLHFTAVAENWVGRLYWRLGRKAARIPLPQGHKAIATCDF